MAVARPKRFTPYPLTSMMRQQASAQGDIWFQVLKRLHKRPDLGHPTLVNGFSTFNLRSFTIYLQAQIKRAREKIQNTDNAAAKCYLAYLPNPVEIVEKYV